jgi:hypothetical protein
LPGSNQIHDSGNLKKIFQNNVPYLNFCEYFRHFLKTECLKIVKIYPISKTEILIFG